MTASQNAKPRSIPWTHRPIHTPDPYQNAGRWSRPFHTSGSPRADPYPNFDATMCIYICDYTYTIIYIYDIYFIVFICIMIWYNIIYNIIIFECVCVCCAIFGIYWQAQETHGGLHVLQTRFCLRCAACAEAGCSFGFGNSAPVQPQGRRMLVWCATRR